MISKPSRLANSALRRILLEGLTYRGCADQSLSRNSLSQWLDAETRKRDPADGPLEDRPSSGFLCPVRAFPFVTNKGIDFELMRTATSTKDERAGMGAARKCCVGGSEMDQRWAGLRKENCAVLCCAVLLAGGVSCGGSLHQRTYSRN